MRTPGERHGCEDGPFATDPYALSRLLDAMDYGEMAGISREAIFGQATDSVKLEFNYSRWCYVPPKG